MDVWLNEHIFPAEASELNPESVLKWTRLSCKEMLLSGTTTCCDGYFYEDEVVKAVGEAGMRAVLGQGVIDFPGPGVPDPSKNITTAVEYVNRHLNKSALISPSIFCHSPYICSKDTLIAAKTAAKELGVLFQIHVAETQNEINMVKDLEGRSIIQCLNDIGSLCNGCENNT
jgi:5-methylthioadenosine/S-adenosylhomocysteine deaminase